MSTRPTYRIVALIMATILFSTSVGISMDFHYCQGELKSVAVFTKAKSCHELAMAKNQMPSCHKHKTMSEDNAQKHEDGCCNNETKVIKMDTDFTDVQTSLTEINPEYFLAAFVHSFLLFNDNSEQEYLSFEHYIPPLPKQDLYILLEQFLI